MSIGGRFFGKSESIGVKEKITIIILTKKNHYLRENQTKGFVFGLLVTIVTTFFVNLKSNSALLYNKVHNF